MRAATGNLKKCSLELGGKSPNIVFADADFDTAVDYALFGIYANAGQVCSAGSRLVLQESIADRFVECLGRTRREDQGRQRVCAGNRDGPVDFTFAHRERSNATSKSAKPKARRLRCGGTRLEGALAGGNFLAPTIFDNTTESMRIVREEIFGPVLVVQTFGDEADAVRIANDTIYGLAGAVFTQDGAKANRVIRKLRAGITWINTYHPTYNEAPWGGYKQSGNGRELGTYGYDAYTEVKQINVNLDVAPSGWFAP